MRYIVVMKLNREFKFRLSSEMLKLLAEMAKRRGPGSKIADLVREAIHKTYFSELTELNKNEPLEKKESE